MNTLSQNRNGLFTFFGLATCLIAIELFVTHNPKFALHPELSLAVTIDILLGLPTLFYFFIIKKFKINKLTIIVAYIASLCVAYFVLPKTHHSYLHWGWESLALLEIGVLFFAITKIRTIVKDYKSLTKIRSDFYLNLKKSVEKSLGTTIFVRILASEITTIRYGLLPFLGKKEVLPHQSVFSSHQKSGYIGLWCAILMCGFAELTALHFLFARFGHTAVLIADILSIYTLILIVADLVALLRRPILIDNQELILRIGIRWNVEIPFSNIENIELIKRLPDEKGVLKAVTISGYNVLLSLKTPVLVNGFYGIRRETMKIAIMVDDEKRFEAEILRGIEK